MDPIAQLVEFLLPTNLADVFIETEGFLFIPILILGYWRGWFRRIPHYMDRVLGLEYWVTCPECGERFEAG